METETRFQCIYSTGGPKSNSFKKKKILIFLCVCRPLFASKFSLLNLKAKRAAMLPHFYFLFFCFPEAQKSINAVLNFPVDKRDAKCISLCVFKLSSLLVFLRLCSQGCTVRVRKSPPPQTGQTAKHRAVMNEGICLRCLRARVCQ